MTNFGLVEDKLDSPEIKKYCNIEMKLIVPTLPSLIKVIFLTKGTKSQKE